MIALKHTEKSTVLLALVFLFATATLFAPVMKQALAAEQQRENAKAVAKGQGPTDEDKLQGKWQIKSIAFEDKVFTKEAKLDAWKDTFDNELSITGDRLSQQANKSKFQLDATSSPKQITIQDESGKLTFRGIYDIQGDTLKVCVNGDGQSERRPEEFATKKGAPVILIELSKSAARQ